MRQLEISHSRTYSSRYCAPDQSSGGMRVRRNLEADVNHDREGLGAAEVTATQFDLLGDARGATIRAIYVINARGRGALQLV